MLNCLNIEIGDPNEKAASYTRFILPFAFKLVEETLSNENSVHWIRDDKIESARQNYFTEETSAVLFENAKWFHLKDNNLQLKLSFGAKAKYTVIVNPRLVLFELSAGFSEENQLNTGFLILELFFEDDQAVPFEALLQLNEVIRYKRKPFNEYPKSKAKMNEEFCTAVREHLGIQTANENCTGDERNFLYWRYFLRQPISFNNKFYSLIEMEGKDWDIYADDRAFVWTCAVTESGGKVFKNVFDYYNKENLQAHNFGHWVKLLNVDYPSTDEENNFLRKNTHQTTGFEREWARERTYHRWEEIGSFYGFSYHSGAALIPPFINPPFWKHFGQMYFDMFLLLLYTRVTVFRFSNELTKISIAATKTDNIEANVLSWRKSFESLRWKFTLFTNLYQFPLISNQQQMLEMYAIARKYLDIQELYNEVKEEIHNNQEYILQRIQQKQSETSLTLTEQSTNLSKQSTLMTTNSLRLTRLATVGLVIGMAVTMLGTEISKWLGSLVSTYLTPNAIKFENGFIVDWFLLIVYLPVFWLLLIGIVKLWETYFGDKK